MEIEQLITAQQTDATWGITLCHVTLTAGRTSLIDKTKVITAITVNSSQTLIPALFIKSQIWTIPEDKVNQIVKECLNSIKRENLCADEITLEEVLALV